MNKIVDYIKHYSYSVSYSLEDEAYLAECLELGIMAHGESQEQAFAEIKEATKIHLLMLEEDGEEIPQPLRLQNTQIII
ncbi:MAG: type II toxin-antitoxin system HicB family antitoxin [Pleurocapsa sp. MO_226.B13]|nr:type II toxin-antitoxin system HicB family antitoxin [Pleurocapsa sp. MO_226.B13]